MPTISGPSKLYPLFTLRAHASARLRRESSHMIIGLASAMFIALFAWGSHYFGWDDPDGKVQMALFTTFILGIICGYKTKS
jgi:hypothetical protein